MLTSATRRRSLEVLVEGLGAGRRLDIEVLEEIERVVRLRRVRRVRRRRRQQTRRHELRERPWGGATAAAAAAVGAGRGLVPGGRTGDQGAGEEHRGQGRGAALQHRGLDAAPDEQGLHGGAAARREGGDQGRQRLRVRGGGRGSGRGGGGRGRRGDAAARRGVDAVGGGGAPSGGVIGIEFRCGARRVDLEPEAALQTPLLLQLQLLLLELLPLLQVALPPLLPRTVPGAYWREIRVQVPDSKR